MPGKRNITKTPIDRGAPASVIADKFGGCSKLAAAIGLSPSGVQRWIVKGHIDGSYHPRIHEAAARLNIKVKPLDFLDTRKPEAKAEAVA